MPAGGVVDLLGSAEGWTGEQELDLAGHGRGDLTEHPLGLEHGGCAAPRRAVGAHDGGRDKGGVDDAGGEIESRLVDRDLPRLLHGHDAVEDRIGRGKGRDEEEHHDTEQVSHLPSAWLRAAPSGARPPLRS